MEAFAYADHKAGLVGRVFRALDDKGRWVFLDTTRTTKKTPPQAFASAWAEPQLATNDEIEELLKLAGFKTVQKASVTELVLAASRQGYANLAQVLESAAQQRLHRPRRRAVPAGAGVGSAELARHDAGARRRRAGDEPLDRRQDRTARRNSN